MTILRDILNEYLYNGGIIENDIEYIIFRNFALFVDKHSAKLFKCYSFFVFKEKN
jgi:hypothetical protein